MPHLGSAVINEHLWCTLSKQWRRYYTRQDPFRVSRFLYMMMKRAKSARSESRQIEWVAVFLSSTSPLRFENGFLNGKMFQDLR